MSIGTRDQRHRSGKEAGAVPEPLRSLMEARHIKGRFAVVRLWRKQAVAEHEVIERMRRSAERLGLELVDVDEFGVPLDGGTRSVTQDDVDFVIHTHFETPRAWDCFSYATLWNPFEFYFYWDFERVMVYQASHDHYISPGSRPAEDIILRLRGDEFRRGDFPVLNHTLSEPILPPRRMTERKAFYCGINWERISGLPMRHGSFLTYLDHSDVLRIYGPDNIREIHPWQGYKSYRGPLPFDGNAVVETAAQCGAVLVLSSVEHIKNGIMSNRLFEALASGALVIANSHPFITDWFSDCVFVIDDALSPEAQARQLLDLIAWANANPDRAMAMAQTAQERFVAKFTMTRQLERLYEHFVTAQERRQAHWEALGGRRKLLLCMIPVVRDAAVLTKLLRALGGQTSRDFFVRVAVQGDDASGITVPPEIADRVSFVDVDSLMQAPQGNFGAILGRLLEADDGYDLCAVSLGFERFFSTYVETKIAQAAQFPMATIRSAGLVEYHTEGVHKLDIHNVKARYIYSGLCATLAFDASRYAAHRPVLDYLDIENWLNIVARGVLGRIEAHYVPRVAVETADVQAMMAAAKTQTPSVPAAIQKRMADAYLTARGLTDTGPKPADAFLTASEITETGPKPSAEHKPPLFELAHWLTAMPWPAPVRARLRQLWYIWKRVISR